MGNRRLDTIELHQLLLRLRANGTDRRIARGAQVDRPNAA